MKIKFLSYMTLNMIYKMVAMLHILLLCNYVTHTVASSKPINFYQAKPIFARILTFYVPTINIVRAL